MFGFNDRSDEIAELRERLEINEQKLEKLLEMVNILATFDERMARDLRSVASHVALMEMSMVDKNKGRQVSFKRKSNDDDMIN
jgi:hypothetical protein